MADFTFRGEDITDLIIKYAVIDDPRERNKLFVKDFIDKVKRSTEEELSGLYFLLGGMNYALRFREKFNLNSQKGDK